MNKSLVKRAPVLLLFLSMFFVSGCLMLSVQTASQRNQTFELQQACKSGKEFIVGYNARVNGRKPTARFAAWDIGILISNEVLHAPLVGHRVGQSRMNREGMQKIPMARLNSELPLLLESNSAVVLPHNNFSRDFTLYSRASDGMTNHVSLAFPEPETYRVAWGTAVLPLALIGDILTAPIQLIYYGWLNPNRGGGDPGLIF